MTTVKPNRFASTPISKGFATDKTLERDGVWRDHESGICVKIRRSTLPEHKRALRKFFKPFQHLTTVDPKDELLVKQKAAAEVLVAQWGVRGEDGSMGPLVDAEGNTIPCSQDAVLEAFVEMPDFFTWVTEEAETFEYYRLGMVADAGGNSPPISAGSGSGEDLLTSSNDGQGAVSTLPPSTTVQS